MSKCRLFMPKNSSVSSSRLSNHFLKSRKIHGGSRNRGRKYRDMKKRTDSAAEVRGEYLSQQQKRDKKAHEPNHP